MSYDISFKAKLEGTEQYVFVGDQWVNHTSNTAAMIKAVCGSYPSDWDGMSCAKLLPALADGIDELKNYSQKYRKFESPGGVWGTVETTLVFLEAVRRNCANFPTATLEVSY